MGVETINGNNIVIQHLKRVQVVAKVGAITDDISGHLICFLCRGVTEYGVFLAFWRVEEERGFREGKRGSAGSMVVSQVLGDRQRWGRPPSRGVVSV